MVLSHLEDKLKAREVEARKPRIVLFDIEAANLNANFGFMLCASWKYLGEKKVHTIDIRDSPTFKRDVTNDKYVAQELKKVIEGADAIVSWYGTRYDYPFVQTRLLGHGLTPMPPVPHIDGWRIAKYKMKLNSNRLATVSEFLEIPEKTPLKPSMWIKAMAGDKKSIGYVIEHCEQDVRVLEEAYERIKPLTTTHPNINLVKDRPDSCPICGGNHLQCRGYIIARTSKRQRYQCRSCGGWSSGKPIRADNVNIR